MTGEYKFKVSMLCQCCEGRNYWISEKELHQIQSSELQEQAMQAIELYLDGVQIGEIGQEDVFSMEDFERELGCSGGMKEQTGRGILSKVADPYS